MECLLKLNEIKAVASKFEIPVIEDAAEGLGSTYFEEPLGTLSEIGIFSFNGNKIITTSSGGALISSNDDMFKRPNFCLLKREMMHRIMSIQILALTIVSVMFVLR